jgi:predicted nucleotidyltransferase
MLARRSILKIMDASQKGGLARARSLSAERRSEIARTAARARWRGRILSRAEIQRQVAESLRGRRAEAYLFGSYGRGEATPLSDVDVMVLFKDPGERADLVTEAGRLRHSLDFGRPVDLLVEDLDFFDEWKTVEGTVQNAVLREGVRLV